MQTVEFDVIGVPAPQGSKRGYVVKGRVVLVESSAAVKPWREDVSQAFAFAMFQRELPNISATAPVVVSVEFRFVKPRTSKLAFPGRRQGDLDKLARATNDGLVMSGYLPDDSQIQGSTLVKRWARTGEMSGARVLISF